MTFHKFIGVWIVVLIVGALSLHKPTPTPVVAVPIAATKIEKPAWQVADEERDEARRIATQRFAEALKLENIRENIRKNEKALQAAIQNLQEPISIPVNSVRSRPQPTTYSYSYQWWSAPVRTCNPLSPRCNY